MVVMAGSPVTDSVSRLLVLETFKVVEFTKGIVRVLKKNVVFVKLARIEPGTVKSLTKRFAKLLVTETLRELEMRLDVVTELVTARFVNSPTLVMLGCAGWLTTSATLAFATFPTKAEL